MYAIKVGNKYLNPQCTLNPDCVDRVVVSIHPLCWNERVMAEHYLKLAREYFDREVMLPGGTNFLLQQMRDKLVQHKAYKDEVDSEIYKVRDSLSSDDDLRYLATLHKRRGTAIDHIIEIRCFVRRYGQYLNRLDKLRQAQYSIVCI